MNISEWADMLDGREIRLEISVPEAVKAREEGVVIVFGASDDLMEFRGAIDEELSAYEGHTALVTSEGLFKECDCDDDWVRRDCKYLVAERKKATKIRADWCPQGAQGPAWVVAPQDTPLPFAKFNIFEEGEVFCQGIVFCLADVVPRAE